MKVAGSQTPFSKQFGHLALLNLPIPLVQNAITSHLKDRQCIGVVAGSADLQVHHVFCGELGPFLTQEAPFSSTREIPPAFYCTKRRMSTTLLSFPSSSCFSRA
jgi:hypothetical protein